jgi:hypothetical protein
VQDVGCRPARRAGQVGDDDGVVHLFREGVGRSRCCEEREG